MAQRFLSAVASVLCIQLLFSAAVTGQGTTNSQIVVVKPSKYEQPVSVLSVGDVAVYRPYTHYASAAYCAPFSIAAWSCGAHCKANPSFRSRATGGDGNAIQQWYVGYDPQLKTAIIAHQGVDLSHDLPIATVLDFELDNLSPSLFPGLSNEIKVHHGFIEAQERAAATVLDGVEKVFKEFNTKNATIVGHSLGGAIGLLDAVYLKLQVPDIHVQVIAYGLPRVGNQAFADYVDEHIKVTRINNREDPIPTVPGQDMGYEHPSGEIHIGYMGTWVKCPGQDNLDVTCTSGHVQSLFDGDISDHSGPYDGVTMGC